MNAKQSPPTSLPEPIIRQREVCPLREEQATQAGMSPLAARVIAARPAAESAINDAALQAHPGLNKLDSPALMKDMERAANRVATAVMTAERIAVETDHDADGVTSHAVIKTALVDHFGHDPQLIDSYIGHRLKEGYGLSQSLAQRILDAPEKPELIITADNGSADEPRIAFLAEHGVDTVVTDHHEIPSSGVPASAVAVLNPTRKYCGYPDPLIAGCMVAWLLMCRVRQILINFGHLPQNQRNPMGDLLDYVAIGTVADCVSMARSLNNRIVVSHGLRRINAASRPVWATALKQLRSEGGMLSEQDIGFGIAPRINSRGRLDEAMAGVHFLMSGDEAEAQSWWELLEQENENRKAIEKDLKQIALNEAIRQRGMGREGLALWLEGGHPGVHGIVASRIVEAYGRPTVCISPVVDRDDAVTGSARGVPGFHVKQALDGIAQAHPDLLEKFGGHEGAGGVTFPKHALETFIQAWNDEVVRQAQDSEMAMRPVIWTDGEVDQPDITMVTELDAALAPFGREFEQPIFEGRFVVESARACGDGTHLSMQLTQNGRTHRAIWFNARRHTDSGLSPYPAEPGDTIHAAFALEENCWRQQIQLQIRIVHANKEF